MLGERSPAAGAGMNAQRPHQDQQWDDVAMAALLSEPIYVYAGLDDAPLILAFEQQLAQQREADAVLRQIAAQIDFDLACLLRGVDPRTVGQG